MDYKEWLDSLTVAGFVTGAVLAEVAWPEQWAAQVMADPKFTGWLASLGVYGSFGRAKSGNVGRAYPVYTLTGKITHFVKFTTDTKEASAAAVLEKSPDAPNHARVFGVRSVGFFDTGTGKKTLYAIVLEAVNTSVAKKHKVAGDAVYNYLDHNPAGIIDLEAAVRATQLMLKPKYQHDPDVLRIVREMMAAIQAINKDKGVLLQDPHGGNLALKNNKVAFFDYGRSSIDYQHPAAASTRIPTLK